ncbi:outer membrane protein [Xanthobacter agilis]|uniref:Outer membrane protein n=2 Tax=Xanthobacter agilis TaxID=47492 RepID=A0ABU0L8C4_XANAG|nr:OmpW family protein [Xanthobacter agilis]MDQ0503383.1 outer membrane protein [Xanthobacter agilis]
MMKFGLGAALAATFGALVAGEAAAADLSTPVYKAPVVEEAQSPWMIRLRALYVKPENGGSVTGVGFSDLDYSDSVTPELDISYFFTKNIAAELILGTTNSTISGAGSLASLGDIAKVWILPPTLTLQYHFTDFGPFKPYIGAGVNYTVFYSQNTKNSAFSSIDVKDTWGLALQAGFDWMFDKHWGVNFDVKKLYLEPDFVLRTPAGGLLNGSANLNPWLIGGGVTYRF